MHDKYSATAHRCFKQSHINLKKKLILYFNATQSHPNILQILLLIIIQRHFNTAHHVQGVQYMLRLWRSDGVLNLNTHFYSVVFDLFCIFRENTHEQQLIQANILYQCPSRNILDFVYGGSHFSTGVIFLRVRHIKNRPL